MNDSYRATLIIVGLFLVVTLASWRLLQLEAAGAQTRPGHSAVVESEPVSSPSPSDAPAARPKPAGKVPVVELIDAARRGDIGAVLNLVGEGVNINGIGPDGLTPLISAIRQGSATPALIEQLLRAGADAAAKDGKGRDALTWAVDKDDVGVIGALLKGSRHLAGQAVEALCYAAGQNHVEALKALLDNNVDINGVDKRGRTALSSAIKEGDPDTVRFLLEHSADPNQKYADGTTPLLLAVARGKRDVIQAVAEKVANVNERNSKGETALMQAVRAGNAEAAGALIDSNSDVNSADFELTTPLMVAAAAGQNELVQTLLAKGANVRAADSKGETALTMAHKSSHGDTADLLAKAGGSEDGSP